MVATLSIVALVAALVGNPPSAPAEAVSPTVAVTAPGAPEAPPAAEAPASSSGSIEHGEAATANSASAPSAAPAAAPGEHAGEHSGPSIQDGLLKPDVAVLFATWLTFGILAWILAKFGWGPITKALDDRESSIAENARRAEAARADAETLVKRYEQQLAGAQGEADKVLAEARTRAEQVGQRLAAEARENATQITNKALQQIEGERQKAVTELRQIVAGAAVDLAGRILKEELNAQRHTKLIDDVVGQISKTN